MNKPLITPEQLAANQARVAAVLTSLDKQARAVAPAMAKAALEIGESLRRAVIPRT